MITAILHQPYSISIPFVLFVILEIRPERPAPQGKCSGILGVIARETYAPGPFFNTPHAVPWYSKQE
jgi:hypothetical protein